MSEIPDDADVVKREPCPVCGTLVDVFHEFTGLIPIEVEGDEANHTKTVCALRVQLKSAAFLIESHKEIKEAEERLAARDRDAYFTMTARADKAELESKRWEASFFGARSEIETLKRELAAAELLVVKVERAAYEEGAVDGIKTAGRLAGLAESAQKRLAHALLDRSEAKAGAKVEVVEEAKAEVVEDPKARWWREVCEVVHARRGAIRSLYVATVDPNPAVGALAMACELMRGDKGNHRAPVDLRLLPVDGVVP